ncbi:LysR family transcriptional regulator, partial [Pseudomonas juntendi]|nr:LysR family transcriptional regulator [Pseudomonas juntendi]
LWCGQGRLRLHWVALAEPWANRRLLVCARDFAALPGYASGLVDRLVGATVLLNY